MSATNTHCPLTINNSTQELTMANANLKPRRICDEHVTRISVALEEATSTGHTTEHRKRPVFPWRQITDTLLEQAGFLPGQQVMFSIDHRFGHITITPDHDYRVAGRYMTGPEAEAMLQRRSKRN
ncbi:hypothetical protein [Paraburkholderia sediminicola]|uniref:hypothetical protein n=1 Tax=Paraburkholderia sediminicola TaxID=458836 RepID=UPI0038BD03D4